MYVYMPLAMMINRRVTLTELGPLRRFAARVAGAYAGDPFCWRASGTAPAGTTAFSDCFTAAR
jgi:hypothetical protein